MKKIRSDNGSEF
jgi:hypothetical protein